MQAQPPLEFIPPALNPLVLRLAQLSLPLWLQFRTEITEIQAERVEVLARLYHQFQKSEVRFLMAFRHPSTNDPLCMAHLVWQLVSRTAKQTGDLQPPVHSHFIYDRGIPLWAGSWVGWLYSRLGGIPIQRGKLDLVGLRTARHLLANSHFPMAVAPEGATNGHNQIVSPVEPGIAQLGFWCVEDLLKAGRSEQVLIVPIGIQYRYKTPPWQTLEKLLTQLELDSGLSTVAQPKTLDELKVPTQPSEPTHISQEAVFYQRLYRLGEHILSLMEKFYSEFYEVRGSPVVSRRGLSDHQIPTKPLLEEVSQLDANAMLAARLHNLLDVALQVAEQYFAIKPKGSLIDRCRRLEQAGWDYIYREELKPTLNLSKVERGLANRVAEEANLRIWHMRIVETFVSVTGHYVKDKLTAERFAETALLLWDLIARIKGDNPFKRPQLGKQQVYMRVGEPISVSQRWDDYQDNRRQAVTSLTRDLQKALEGMILT